MTLQGALQGARGLSPLFHTESDGGKKASTGMMLCTLV